MPIHIAGRKIPAQLRKGITSLQVEVAEELPTAVDPPSEATQETPAVGETPAQLVSSGVHSISLDLSVVKIAALLQTGGFDEVLDTVEALETQGRNRKGVLAAIVARRTQL